MTRTKTALETTADLAAKYAAHTLRQMLYVAASDDNIDAAVEAIGQHAIALMKLTIEREHVVMRQRASGRLDFGGFAPNTPKPGAPEPELTATAGSAAYRQAVGSVPQFEPVPRGTPEYTERDVEMFARGLHCQDYFRGNSKRVWLELSIDERGDVLGIARRALGPRTGVPGEPRR